MKRKSMRRLDCRILSIFVAVVLLPVLVSCSCSLRRHPDFAIVLADNGEVLLTEREVKAYHSNNSTFELNAEGIKKWNSQLTYRDIPKLADSLFSREFVLEIEGTEVCRGKFWSGASSSSYFGVVIMDSLFKLDSNHNVIWIESGYPAGTAPPPAVDTELARFFQKRESLK